jgi:hypothetical protein
VCPNLRNQLLTHTFPFQTHSLLFIVRIPSEGQIVARILTVFSKDYYERTSASSDNTFRNEDAVLVLALAIVFLNVDQHSPNIIGERMTLVFYNSHHSFIHAREEERIRESFL